MRDMSRWLGDGGMPLLSALGVRLEGFGAEGDPPASDGRPAVGGEGGWSLADWQPTELACNHRGVVQGGVHSVVLDAVMHFALNASLDGADRSRATLEMKTETMRPATAGEPLTAVGRLVRLARQVAWTEGLVRNRAGQVVSRSTATFLVHRGETGSP